MRTLLRVLAVALAVLSAGVFVVHAQQQQAPPPPAVKVGQAAPDFTLRYLAPGPNDTFTQKTVSLSEFKGKHTVILAFFPAAFSPG